jgi:hypothetical protein
MIFKGFYYFNNYFVFKKVRQYDPIPEIEWWDQIILPAQQKSYVFDKYNTEFRFEINSRQVTNMIEHPIPFTNPLQVSH